MDETLTLRHLKELCATLPAAPTDDLFITLEVERKLRDASPEPDPRNLVASLYGMPFFVMPGQKADGWLISDRQVAKDYREGKLTEADLLRMSAGSPSSASQVKCRHDR